MDDKGAASRGGRERGVIPWAEIRRTFEIEGITNIAELHRRFGVKRDYIAKRRDREQWQVQSQEAALLRSKIVDIKTRRTIDMVAHDIAREFADNPDLEGLVNAELINAVTLARLTRQYLEDALTKAVEAPGSVARGRGRGTFDAVNAAVAAVRNFNGLIRDIAGLLPGKPNQDVQDGGEKKRLIVEQIIAQPVQVPVDGNGRLVEAS